MTDDRKAGIALMAGSVGGLVTMAIHPVMSGGLTGAQFEHLALVSAVAHSLAIASSLASFLGALGLTRRVAAADRLSLAALVTYGLALVAIVQAAAISGFIEPDIMRRMMRDTPANGSIWRIVVVAFFQINQAYARIFTVAASAAVALWSVSALRDGGLGRAKAIYGCVASPLLMFGIVSGHLRLDVHGMALVGLAQGIWFISVGAELYERNFVAAPTNGHL